MLSQNKTVNYVVGGLAIASLALFAYTVTRPTRISKKSKRSKRKRDPNKKKSKKYVKTFTKKPIDIHLVMETMDGFNAHIAGDKKNDKQDLKYGSRLIKINDKRVDNLSYQEIYELLQKTKTPIALQFRQFDELCHNWTQAEKLKEAANVDFKEKEIESAIKKVTAAIELHPTNKIYYSNRILMLLQNNKYNEALEDCQIIRELDPKSVYIKGHYLRGLTLLKLKKFKNAASAFQTVVKLNPEFKKAKDRLTECLKELQQDTDDEKRRISSKQLELKQTFEEKQDNDNDKESIQEKQEKEAVPEVPEAEEPEKQEEQQAATEEEQQAKEPKPEASTEEEQAKEPKPEATTEEEQAKEKEPKQEANQ